MANSETRDNFGFDPEEAHGYGERVFPARPASGVPLADLSQRIAAALIDTSLYLPGYVAIWTAEMMTGVEAAALSVVGLVAVLAVLVWNHGLNGGRTGYTVGKGVMGIKLVRENTGQTVGTGYALLRQLAHILDGIPCYLGYLWPAWDDKKQTFADKIMRTVVIQQPKSR